MLSCATAAMVAMIYYNLHVKKRRYFDREKISGQLNQWISEALTEEGELTIAVEPWLQQYLNKGIYREYVADSLINVRKNLKGAAAKNIISLYLQLDLKKDSLQKLRGFNWHQKARGIYELYMMEQADAAADIARHTNSSNETVRMEAQVATVGFSGFDGLTFLTSLTHPVNEWQQLQLLAQLQKLNVEDMPELPQWLASANITVQLFALKLADIYNQFHVHDLVVSCLQSTTEEIRNQAIKTLGHISNEDTAQVLKEQYEAETNANKRAILKQIGAIGMCDDVPFLRNALEHPDDSVKLEALRAIAICDRQQWSEICTGMAHSATLLSLSKQVNYELEL